MAQLKDLLVSGSSRLLGTLYCNNVNINGAATFNGDTAFTSGITSKKQIVVNSTVGGHCNDGMRLNLSSAGWSCLTLGGASGSTTGAGTGVWSLLTNGGTFYISHNGSRNAAYRLQGTKTGAWSLYGSNYSINPGSGVDLNNALFAVNLNTSISGTFSVTGKSTLGETAISTLTTSTITSNNVIVKDTLRSSKWEIETISNMGGSLYVAPTLMIKDGSTCAVQKTDSTTFTLTIIDSSNITSDALGGHTWTSGSKVKIAGRIGDVVLGTCNAVLTAKMNITSGRLSLTVTSDQAASFSTTATNLTSKNLTVMLYEVANGSNSFPVGIYMTSYGVNKYSYIDIYNGAQAGITTRIGKLDGAPAVNGVSPTGYGIYTNNGYFDGVIVSQSGKIGGWNLAASSLYNVTNSMTSTGVGIYLGTDGIRNYKDANTYVNIKDGVITAKAVDLSGKITATSGTIGGCTISNGVLQVANANITGTISGSKITASTLSAGAIDTSTLTASSGVVTSLKSTLITADNINALSINATTVKSGSAAIGNWAVNSDGLYYSNATPGGTTSNATIYPAGKSATISALSSSAQNWAFTLGQKFGVTNAGAMYAKSGYIGKYQITDTYLTTGSGTTSTGIGGNQAFWAGNSSSNDAPFRVAYDGTLNATKAIISGNITADSGTIGGCSITGGVLQIADVNITGTISGSKILIGAEETSDTLDNKLDNLDSGLQGVVDDVNERVSVEQFEEEQSIRDAEAELLNSQIDGINNKMSEELVAKGYAKITDAPSVELGKNESAWKVVITNNGIYLQKNETSVASLSQEVGSQETTLSADNARLSNVKFRSVNGMGKLGIVAQSNGHVSLKEI